MESGFGVIKIRGPSGVWLLAVSRSGRWRLFVQMRLHLSSNLEHEVWGRGKKSSDRWLRKDSQVGAAEEARVGAPRDILQWAQEQFGFAPDDLQARVLESTARRGILKCSRQWGKSTVAALKALWTALQTPKATVLVMSPSGRQSKEFVGKVEEFVKAMGLKIKRNRGNDMSVELPNGSRIVGIPGVEATMRGYSAVDLLIIDEAARVLDRQYYAAGPCLAVKNGALWLLSTPFGARGFFWKEWERPDGEWEKIAATAEECARIAPEFLEMEKRRMGEEWYRQEYLCEFVGVEGGSFREEWIEAAMREGIHELVC